MNKYELAAQEIGSALAKAEIIAHIDEYVDHHYRQMRECILSALQLLTPPEKSTAEPWAALDWAAAHLPTPEAVESGVIVRVNPRKLDPILHPHASMRGRATWVHEHQGERLLNAVETLRTVAAVENGKAISRKQLNAMLVELDPSSRDKQSARANRIARAVENGDLVELERGKFQEASVNAFLANWKPTRNRGEDYDPLDI